MYDETENARRARKAELDAEMAELIRQSEITSKGAELSPAAQHELDVFRDIEARYGEVWDTQGLRRDFEVLGFLAPFVIVKHKLTGKKGSLEFIHSPRMYFNWQEDR